MAGFDYNAPGGGQGFPAPPENVWQIFNIGLGFFVIGVIVHIFSPALLPSGIEAMGNLKAGANYQTAVLLANWFLGLGSFVIATSCVFLCLKALRH